MCTRPCATRTRNSSVGSCDESAQELMSCSRTHSLGVERVTAVSTPVNSGHSAT